MNDSFCKSLSKLNDEFFSSIIITYGCFTSKTSSEIIANPTFFDPIQSMLENINSDLNILNNIINNKSIKNINENRSESHGKSEVLNTFSISKQVDSNSFTSQKQTKKLLLFKTVTCLPQPTRKDITVKEEMPSPQLKRAYKFRSDGIKKKIKNMLNRYIIMKINEMLSVEQPDLGEFKRFPKKLSNDINIQFNCILLNSSIKDIIIHDYSSSNSNERAKANNNKALISKITVKSIKELLDRTMLEWFRIFQQDEEELNRKYMSLSIKKGENYLKQLKKCFNSYIEYFIRD